MIGWLKDQRRYDNQTRAETESSAQRSQCNVLGYTRVETILPDKTKQVDFVIDPEQAETVRMIFDLYLDGYGLVKIKDELELRGRKTSQGKDSLQALVEWSYHTNIRKETANYVFFCAVSNLRNLLYLIGQYTSAM